MMNLKENKITAGMASFGMSGMVFHGPLLYAHSGFYLKSVLQRSKSTARDFYPDINIVKSYDELLQDEGIELIIVNTTNDTHFQFTKSALEAGKNVVVEKPFTNTVKEGLHLIELADKHNLVLSVFQNRRWDSDFLTVQQIVKEGLLGEIVEFIGSFDRYRNYIQENTWKEETGPGSGLLYNLGPHLIDQVLVLFGKPDGVFADIRKVRKGTSVDDFFDIGLYYDHLKARLHSSYLVREPFPRFVLHGAFGSFIKYGLDPQEADLKAGGLPGTPGWGLEKKSIRGQINTEINGLAIAGTVTSKPGNYLAYYDNIYNVIRKKEKLMVPAIESLLNIYIIELAKKSAEKGQVLECKQDWFKV